MNTEIARLRRSPDLTMLGTTSDYSKNRKRLTSRQTFAGLGLLAALCGTAEALGACSSQSPKSHDVAVIHDGGKYLSADFPRPEYGRKYPYNIGPLLCTRTGPATITSVEPVETKGNKIAITGWGLYLAMPGPGPTLRDEMDIASGQRPVILDHTTDACRPNHYPSTLVITFAVEKNAAQNSSAVRNCAHVGGIEVNYKAGSADGSVLLPGRGIDICFGGK